MAPTETADNEIRFTVYGRPQTAGSKRAFPYKKKNGNLGVRVADDNKNTKTWQSCVQDAARKRYQGDALDGPLHVVMSFYFLRPKSHYGSGRNSGLVKESAPVRPSKRPDVLKLARAVEDALTGVLWRDDAQIVVETLEKDYDGIERCEVTVAKWLAETKGGEV